MDTALIKDTWSRFCKRRANVVTVLIAMMATAALWWMFAHDPAREGYWRSEKAAPLPQKGSSLPTPVASLYMPLGADEAKIKNDDIPFSTAPVETALPMVLPSTELLFSSRRNAVKCLTAAIYYEGAAEPAQGKRGIAQVVLNRVRHPAFPNSVCDVVYQGSERRTGCQFTFTCDGSLARKPSRGGWEAAQRHAIAALGGAVEPRVGMSTHYHADYVVPYWAPSLEKVVKLGAHIFYRWSGSWGRRAAFTQHVSLDNAVVEAPQIEDLLASQGQTIGLPGRDMPPVPALNLRADQLRGELVDTVPESEMSGVRPAPALRADGKRASPKADETAGSLKLD